MILIAFSTKGGTLELAITIIISGHPIRCVINALQVRAHLPIAFLIFKPFFLPLVSFDIPILRVLAEDPT